MKYSISLFVVSALAFCSCDDSQNERAFPPEEEAVSYTSIQKRSDKRGVSYSFQLPEVDTELLGNGISWAYNWGPDTSSSLSAAFTEYKIDFFPMAWNDMFSADRIRSYKLTHPECQYILAFNEPNLKDQANMLPQQAAAEWQKLRALATELNMKLISPAMNYGTVEGYSNPIQWLDEFFQLVPLSDIDGIAIHCYMSNPSSLKNYVSKFKKYGKPIWMTEFCAWEKSISGVKAQMAYMSDVINYMESDPDIFRYAWFIPRGKESDDEYPYNKLLSKRKPYQLTELGRVFVNMSTLDKNTYYNKAQVIPAEHYSGINVEETASEEIWTKGPQLQPTTDKGGILELCNFLSNQWVEYLINVPESGYYQIDMRYACYLKSDIEISIGNATVASTELPNTKDIWSTISTKAQLPKGKHTIRFKMTSGNINLNWVCFK